MGLSHTVSGDIASFRTPSRVPIESLKFHFLPKQAAGTPSPENPIPIEGWTGLSGKRASKNIGRIVNFSANSGQIGETAPQLTNKYGTALSTITYSLPDTELVITQTDHDEPTDTSYKNGYFAVWIDTLEYNQRYDVSFKVKDVVDPLNVGLNRLRINGPSGGSSQFPTEIHDGTIIYRNVLHAPYINEGVTKNRKGWEFRLCGMSMKVSEIMVTPANKSDGVFEPYSGSAFPVTFPVLSKNLLNPRSAMFDHGAYTITGDVIKQTSSDGRGWDSDSQMPPIKLPAGTYTISCSAAVAINLRTSADNYSTNTRFENGVGTFTIGNDVSIKFKCASSVYPVSYTLQIESGNVATEYEPFLYGSIWLGGYYDPVAGELVCSWRKFKLKEYEWAYKEGNHRFQMQLPSTEKSSSASSGWTNFAISDSYKPSNYSGYVDLMIAGYGNNYIYIRDDRYTSETDFVEAMGEVEIAYELANPIHIPVAPQDLKAFLDRNNFWSDANDITEVTYAVTESKDMLATRKLAMNFDMGHHKKVKWNQLIVDGNFTDSTKWATNENYGSVSVSNNVGTWTCSITPDYYYRTGIMEKKEHLEIPEDHKVLLRATVRSSVAIRIALYALARGNEHSNPYYQEINANEWSTICGFVVNRNVDKIFTKGKICYGADSQNIVNIIPGTTLEAKNFMFFDFTQMFGAGNEPTKTEFEHICELNNIDLTTYQPYDAGSDRWLIIP